MAIPSTIIGPVSIIELCAGGAGLGLGVGLAFDSIGVECRTQCYVEWEGYAAATLVGRIQDQALGEAPIWDNLRTFDGRPWRGKFHGLLAGYPCQPFSLAGRRAGAADERHLWPEVLRAIEEIEPAFVFLENVAGHLSLGFDVVKADLDRVGYRIAAGLFTAAEVGASHRRERLFILGFRNMADGEVKRCGPWRAEPARWSGEFDAAKCGGAVANCQGQRDGSIPTRPRHEGQGEAESDGGGEGLADSSTAPVLKTPSSRSGKARGTFIASTSNPMDNPHGQQIDGRGIGGIHEAAGQASGTVGDTEGDERRCKLATGEPGEHGRTRFAGDGDELADARRERQQGECGGRPAARTTRRSGGTEIPVFPPGPGERERWAGILAERPELAPAVESPVRGMADGLAEPVGYRNDELRLLGNGVVPLEAAYGFLSLLTHFEE